MKNAFYFVDCVACCSPYNFVRLMRNLLVSSYNIVFPRFILIIILGLLFSTFLFASVANAAFPDVGENNPHSAAIDSLVAQGILKGYEDGSFKPDQNVTRAEAVKIALMGMGIANEETAKTMGAELPALTFSDVSNTDWFYDYLKVAVSKGIVKGYEDGTYKPSQTVNRAEAMKLVLVAASASGTVSSVLTIPVPSENAFVDTPYDSWFGGLATYAKKYNVEPAQTDGKWHPEENMSRAKISEMVYRMQAVKNNQAAFDESTNWATRPFPTVSISLKVPSGWSYKPDGVGAVWLMDKANNQYSLLDPYSNGGTLLMTRYSNTEGKNATELFAQIQKDLNVTSKEMTIGGYSALQVETAAGERWREWYIVVPNNTMIHFVGLRGEGYYKGYLESYIWQTISSIVYVAQDELSMDDVLEAIRSAIDVDGEGTNAINLLSDASIFETDAIGVGTGPVDYYYSKTADISIKYERSYDVILDIRDGQTSAF